MVSAILLEAVYSGQEKYRVVGFEVVGSMLGARVD
jgi:hypothetical protein